MLDPHHHKSDSLSSLAKRTQAQESLRSGLEFSTVQCLCLFGWFLAMSVVAFSFWLDHWSLVDAMYFAVVTCTTVGYGDLVPQSAAGRVFTCLYALAGVCVLGIVLGVLGNHMVEAEEAAVERTSTMAKKRLLSLFSASQPKTQQQQSSSTPTPKTTDQQEEDHQHDVVEEDAHEQEVEQELFAQQIAEEQKVHSSSQGSAILWRLLLHFLMILMLLTIFAFCMANDSGVGMNTNGEADFFDAFYFTIVTATTVGYGDYSPESERGRILAIFFIPMAVGAMGHFLSSVAEAIMESRALKVRRRFAARDMSLQDLEIMDADGDGKVSRAEFLEFMLVAMDKVDHDFIEEMRQHFARLDVDGTGVLSKDDLIEHARRKLGRIQSKLELAAYKETLLRQAAAQRQRRRRSGHSWSNVTFVARQRWQPLARTLRRASTFFVPGHSYHHTHMGESSYSHRHRAHTYGHAPTASTTPTSTAAAAAAVAAAADSGRFTSSFASTLSIDSTDDFSFDDHHHHPFHQHHHAPPHHSVSAPPSYHDDDHSTNADTAVRLDYSGVSFGSDPGDGSGGLDGDRRGTEHGGSGRYGRSGLPTLHEQLGDETP